MGIHRLIVGMWAAAFVFGESEITAYFTNLGLIGGYFANIDNFVLPINEYHEFYLFWWFSWSIMIGQFTSRFVGGLKTYQVMLAMMVIPSIPDCGLVFSTVPLSQCRYSY